METTEKERQTMRGTIIEISQPKTSMTRTGKERYMRWAVLRREDGPTWTTKSIYLSDLDKTRFERLYGALREGDRVEITQIKKGVYWNVESIKQLNETKDTPPTKRKMYHKVHKFSLSDAEGKLNEYASKYNAIATQTHVDFHNEIMLAVFYMR